MRLSRASSYALHALAFLADRKSDQPVASHTVAEADHTPERFLLKVLRPLVSAGVLRSLKGPNGGYRLARTADRITLREVIEAVDGPLRGEVPQWNDKEGVPLDTRLQTICDQASERTRKVLDKVRLSDLIAKDAGGAAKEAPAPTKGRKRKGG
jgi:Rrf2 family protein